MLMRGRAKADHPAWEFGCGALREPVSYELISQAYEGSGTGGGEGRRRVATGRTTPMLQTAQHPAHEAHASPRSWSGRVGLFRVAMVFEPTNASASVS
ncbi:hypothetical protein AMK29_20655 [Streptomyces sp. CB02261]|nr:hypothetical protein AMK29_20655 [Streptomyces sp. CB02261]